MRRESLLGAGLVLAAVAELQWSSTFFADDDVVLAATLFVAAAGLLLAAGGAFIDDIRAWAMWSGLALAAVAHGAYLGSTLDFGWMLVVAAGLATVGLAAAAWGARSDPMWSRAGLALAAGGGVVWTYTDLSVAHYAFMVGNVFATVGWALAAVYATEKKAS